MIQRVQTLFMLLAIGGITAMYLTPIGAFTADNHHYVLSIYGIKDEAGVPFPEVVSSNFVYIPLAVALILTIYAIFQFGRRKTQMQVNKISIVLMLVSAFLMALFLKNAGDMMPERHIGFGVAFFMPYLCILLLVFANRAIKKDDDLVRSVDRIR
ncbi:MAG: DUF4293 domain-containing protein [Flavobacteriales bacterium]